MRCAYGRQAMNFRMLTRSSALIMLAAVCGCGQGSSDSTVHSDSARGYTVEFPDSWQLATQQMSRITRHFHTLVRVGPDAPPGSVAEAWRVLDSLQLDPDYQPDWRASG